MFRLTRLFASILLCSLWYSFGFAQPPVFYFTGIPDQDEAALVQRYEKLVAYFEKKLGIRTEYVPVSSYEASVQAFASGRVQLGWFGAYTGIKARQAVPGSEILAQGEKDQKFKSYFIAHSSTGLKPSKNFPREIQGKSFLYGAPMSTSGRIIPEFWIRQYFGKSPKAVFSRVSFSGDHSSTLDLIQAGVADVGAMDYTVFEAAEKAGLVDPAKVTVIWETPPFPDNAFVLRGDVNDTFGEGFNAKVKQAILDLDDENILKAFGRPKFVSASNEQYSFIEGFALRLAEEDR